MLLKLLNDCLSFVRLTVQDDWLQAKPLQEDFKFGFQCMVVAVNNECDGIRSRPVRRPDSSNKLSEVLARSRPQRISANGRTI